jgi:hypothetical protein
MDKTNFRAAPSADDLISLGDLYKFLRNSQDEHWQAQRSQDKIKKPKNRPTTDLLYLAVSSASKKKDSEPPSLNVRQDYFQDANGTLHRILSSLLLDIQDVPNSGTAVKKVVSDNLDQRNWVVNDLSTNIGQALEAQRLHSPLSNGYAKQWEKRRRDIASEMIRLNKNSTPTTPKRLAGRSKIILHALSKLPHDFGFCNDEDEISAKLKNVISQLDPDEQNKVAQLALPIQLGLDACHPAVINKLSFALALNRVIRYFAAGDASLQNYSQRSFRADIKILANFAREEARTSGVRYKPARENSPKLESRCLLFNSLSDVTSAPLSSRPESPPSSSREKEKVPERQRAQSAATADSPRKSQRPEPHHTSRVAADHPKINARQDRKSSRTLTLDLQPPLEAPAPLKSPGRHSQKLNCLNDNNSQYVARGDAGSDWEEPGAEQRRVSRSNPDTGASSGKPVYKGRKAAEHRKSQTFSPDYWQPVTPRGSQNLNSASTSLEDAVPQAGENGVTLPDLSTVFEAGFFNRNEPGEEGKNSDASTFEMTESYMFDSITSTINFDSSTNMMQTIDPAPEVSKPRTKGEDKTLRAQPDNGAHGRKATVQRRIPDDGVKQRNSQSDSASTSITD